MRKKCGSCGKYKLLNEFFRRKCNVDGRTASCAQCLRHARKLARIYQAKKNTGVVRKEYLYRKGEHKITAEIYDKLVELKNNACNICGKTPDYRLIVDHCYKDGHIRGLLCRQCNSGLGMFKDNKNFLSAAISYLDSKIDLKSL